jgi:hypothetical protein
MLILRGFWAVFLRGICSSFFSLIDLSAAVTVVEPCLYTYTLGPEVRCEEPCLMALEVASYWLGPSTLTLLDRR